MSNTPIKAYAEIDQEVCSKVLNALAELEQISVSFLIHHSFSTFIFKNLSSFSSWRRRRV